VDLPEPDTPVITVKRSRGISRSEILRLCSRALCTRIAAGRFLAGPLVGVFGASVLAKDLPRAVS